MLTFLEFKTLYNKGDNAEHRKEALYFARQLGVTLAQCQLWVRQLTTTKKDR